MIRRVRRCLLTVCLLLTLLVGFTSIARQGRVAPVAARSVAASLPLCKGLGSSKDLLSGQQSGLATVKQGYQCLLRHYITGKHLNHRTLLRGGYNAISTALNAQLPGAFDGLSLPPLTGDSTADWQTFALAYKALLARIQPLPPVLQAVAQICVSAMAESLHDDHTVYLQPAFMKLIIKQLFDEGPTLTLGIVTSPITTTATALYIDDVFPNSPAATAGLRPGDVIQQVGGQPALNGGQLGANAISLILPQNGKSVTLTVQRPATGAQLTFTITPRSMVTPDTSARVLPGNVAYVKLYNFTEHAYTRVLDAMRGLGLGASARGLVLDLRGNGGGVEDQAVQLVSAFVHHATLSYAVDGNGHREALTTDNKVPLLHLPLVVLIDGGSASSSELVADAVHDLHLGKLVGERSAGDINSAGFYGLSDGSGLEITEQRVLGAKGEAIDHTGITPDVQAPVTAAGLSAGNDPAVSQADALLQP